MNKSSTGLANLAGILTLGIIVTLLLGFASFASADPQDPNVHNPTITISPNVANCEDVLNTFIVHVANDANSIDSIFEVRIYNGTTGIETFACGLAPTGWALYDFTTEYGYCEYKTQAQGEYVILPGDDLDFTFNSEIYKGDCYSTFLISTLDNATFPYGEHKFNTPELKIDCTSPQIDKIVGEPKIIGDGFDWWVNYDTVIDFNAHDDQSPNQCDLGIEYCKYRITIDGVVGDWIFAEIDDIYDIYWNFQMQEDSNHYIEVECKDIAGNMGIGVLEETDKVDGTPPETTKVYGTPNFVLEGDINDGAAYPHWISQSTPITLTAVDPDPTGYSCDIGVDTLYYRDFVVSNEFCQYEYIEGDFLPDTGCGPDCYVCHPENYGNPDIPFEEVNGNEVTFYKEEDSCHVIEYYAVDELGNEELLNFQCVYVETQAPNLWKEHGKGTITDYSAEFETANNPEGEFHWLTQNTPIDLYCEDQGEHPVDHVTLNWRIWDDVSGTWTEWDSSAGEFVDETIYFGEDSVHKLQYYCYDALGNSEGTEAEPHEQFYKVDTTPPTITKAMIGVDHLGDCPPVGPDDICYVADNGQNGVSMSVVDGGDVCAVDNVSCSYEVIWHTDLFDEVVDSGEFSEYAEIIFTEDSTHELVIECEDALGNTVEDSEIFLVDSKPPVTTKTYGEPYVVDPDCYAYFEDWCVDHYTIDEYEDAEACTIAKTHAFCPQWITSGTPVTLESWDAKVGVDKIYWRNLWLPNNDEVCYHSLMDINDYQTDTVPYTCDPNYYAQFVQDYETTPWNEYDVPFYKPEESCHVIEYYAVDYLGNEESLQWQCVFVDNTPPQGEKIVGDPNVMCQMDQIPAGDDCESQSRTYTLDADFDEGVLIGIEHDTVADQLQLILGEVSTFPVLWVANAGEDTLSKWDTNTNKELARYHTWFGPQGTHGAWSGPAPSRTAVDSDGNAYVSNRHFDSKPANVFKILSNDWIDRNGNGVMDTSFDANDDGAISASEMLQFNDDNSNGIIDDEEITDERVAWVTTVGTNSCLGRSLAIDLDGNIWLGCYGTQNYYKLDGNDGSIIDGPIDVSPNSPYGALVDKHGILWGASLNNQLLRLDTATNDVQVFTEGGYDYGIAIGYDNEDYTQVYLGGNYPYEQYDSQTGTFSFPASYSYTTLGIAVDIDGNIVAGDSSTGAVSKFAPDGTLMWTAPAQAGVTQSRGTVVDSNNDIWVIDVYADKMAKFSGVDGTHLGVFNTGMGPYTYSDATGLGLKGSISSGTWSVIYDAGADNTELGPVSWNADVPEDTTLTIRVRSSNDQASWSPWETVSDGVAFSTTPNGRYLEVEVSMKSSSEESPVLYDLTVEGGCPTEPPEEPMCDYYVTTGTPISLSCEDVGPHPVDYALLKWRFSYWENGYDGTPEYSQWYESYEPVEIYFPEDSWHDLEYYCEDALGNMMDVDAEYFIVDTVPPEINKEIDGPYYGDCPPEEEGDVCYLDGVTQITIDPVDPQPHPVDDVSCYYWYYVYEDWADYDDGEWDFRAPESGVYSTFPINFPEESIHELHIVCKDALDNKVEDVEVFAVDKTPPTILKEYGVPYFTDGTSEWITPDTPIYLTVEDTGPHPSGVDEVQYLIQQVDDSYCYAPETCGDAVLNGDWFVWNGEPIQVGEESCHVIAIRAWDNVDKYSEHRQCAFVEETPPTIVKDNGVAIPDTGETAFMNEGNPEGDFHWLTTQMPITFTCEDETPHPVDHEQFCYRVSYDYTEIEPGDYDWGYITNDYCEGDLNQDGYCCMNLDGDPFEFYFGEESMHNLEYYCADILGNGLEPHTQYYKVDDTAPEFWKVIGEPQYMDGYYITSDTNLCLSWQDGGEICAVDDVSCYWRYEYQDAMYPVEDWYTYNPDTCINLPDDCEHTLEFYCEDALGNAFEPIIQEHSVDNTPPESHITEPHQKFAPTDDGKVKVCWNTTDEKSGVDYTDVYWQELGNEWNLLGTFDALEAVIETESCESWDCLKDPTGAWDHKDFFVTGRSDTTNWDMAIWNGNPEQVETQGEFAWVNDGEPVPFTVIYDAETGLVTYDIDGTELTWTYDTEKAFDYLVLMAKGGDAKGDTYLYDVEVNGVPVGDVMSDANYQGLKVLMNDYSQMDGFIVTGYVSMEWYEGHPQEIPAFHVFAMNTHEPILEQCALFTQAYFNEEYCFKTESTDNLGNMEVKEDADICSTVVEFKFRIRLHNNPDPSMWNLISVPVVPADDNIETLTEDIQDELKSVWTYDTATDEWYVYWPDNASASNLDNMEPGWGYWVSVYEDAILEVGGSLTSEVQIPPVRTLVPGWNLIGYYGIDDPNHMWYPTDIADYPDLSNPSGTNQADPGAGPQGNGKMAYCALYTLTNPGETIIWDGVSFPAPWWQSMLGYWNEWTPRFFGVGWNEYLDPGAGYWIYLPNDKEEYGYTVPYSAPPQCGEWWVW